MNQVNQIVRTKEELALIERERVEFEKWLLWKVGARENRELASKILAQSEGNYILSYVRDAWGGWTGQVGILGF